MHEKRRYVESRHGRYGLAMRRLLPCLAAAALAAPSAAQAERVADGTGEAALHAGTSPLVAYLHGRELLVATRDVAWSSTGVARLPDDSGRVVAVRPGFVLVESRRGLWLRALVRGERRWRTLRIADAPKDGALGPAGLAFSRRGRPTIAYSIRSAGDATELWVVQVAPSRRLGRTRVTRRGFPPSRVPPAAAPVVMPDGTIRVVQTFSQRGANAIFWRREGDRWWGRVLHAGVLGTSGLPVFTAMLDDDLYLAWTVVYPTQRELHVLLTTRTDRSRSIVVHRNAFAAGVALGPNGAEVAANENVAGLDAGLVFFPQLQTFAPSPPVELDGRIVAYTRDSAGGGQVLLARNDGLEWFRSPELPSVRILLDGPLSGRIDGAAGGVVRVYRERPGAARELVVETPVLADGRFEAIDPFPVPGTYYRFVYERELPYAFLARTPVP